MSLSPPIILVPFPNIMTNILGRYGSLYNEIIKLNPARLDEIKMSVEKELEEKYGAAPMVAPMRAIICQAWK